MNHAMSSALPVIQSIFLNLVARFTTRVIVSHRAAVVEQQLWKTRLRAGWFGKCHSRLPELRTEAARWRTPEIAMKSHDWLPRPAFPCLSKLSIRHVLKMQSQMF